jgi:hypothetical protein
VRLAIHVRGDPLGFVPRLGELAPDVAPDLIVSVTGPRDDGFEGDWYMVVAMSLGAGLRGVGPLTGAPGSCPAEVGRRTVFALSSGHCHTGGRTGTSTAEGSMLLEREQDLELRPAAGR